MTQTTTTKKKSSIDAKVLSINTLYEWAEKFFKYEQDHFRQFLGKDIFKVDGSVKAKFEHPKLNAKGQLEDGTFYDVHYWFENRHGYFVIKIKSCINGGSYDDKSYFCIYDEIGQTLFEVKDGLLVETTQQPTDFSIRYDAKELQAIAENIKEAAESYRQAANKMPYAFQDVFYIERLSR